MIRHEGAVSLSVTSPARAGSMDRFGRWLACKGWVHLLLLTGTGICLFPMLWMFMTSIKTDEELAQVEMVPKIPSFRARSPYVRPLVNIAKPDEVDESPYRSALPLLREATTFAVRAALPELLPAGVDSQQWVASATSVILNRALSQMPKSAWLSGPPAVYPLGNLRLAEVRADD
jgi:ABC-type glycerol-3-phosphate transport system permease component